MTDQKVKFNKEENAKNLLEFCQFGTFKREETLKLITHNSGVKFRIDKGNCSHVYYNSPLFSHLVKPTINNEHKSYNNINNTLVDISNTLPMCQSNYSHEVIPLPFISNSRQPIIHQSQTMTLGRREKTDLIENNISLIQEKTTQNSFEIPNNINSDTNHNKQQQQQPSNPENLQISNNKCPMSWSSLFENKQIKKTPKQKSLSNGATKIDLIDKVDALEKGRRLYTFLTGTPVAKEPPQPRGLINRGNLCYVHAALQAIVCCSEFSSLIQSFEPFPSLSTKPSVTPVFDSLILFLNEFATVKTSVYVTSGRTRKQPQIKPVPPPIEPIYIYNMIKKLRPPNLSLRKQEDSEEFLGFILQKLHEEMSTVIEIYKEDAKIESTDETPEIESPILDSEWLEVGKGNKTASTRRNIINSTPISQIFCGEIRSSIQLSKSKDSVTHQPFFSLQLDIQNNDVTTIQHALVSLLRTEEVSGYIDSNSNETTILRKQSLSKLPSVLILHIKRFNFITEMCYKVSKQISYSAKLTLPSSLLSHEFREKAPVTYQLIAVIYHHGESATGGHYTCAILCESSKQWILTDDKEMYAITEDLVLQHQVKRTAYLLFYKIT